MGADQLLSVQEEAQSQSDTLSQSQELQGATYLGGGGREDPRPQSYYTHITLDPGFWSCAQSDLWPGGSLKMALSLGAGPASPFSLPCCRAGRPCVFGGCAIESGQIHPCLACCSPLLADLPIHGLRLSSAQEHRHTGTQCGVCVCVCKQRKKWGSK